MVTFKSNGKTVTFNAKKGKGKKKRKSSAKQIAWRKKFAAKYGKHKK